jgi:hypothetical protein
MAFRMYVDESFDTLPSSAVCGSSDEVFRKTTGELPPPKTGAQTLSQLLYVYKHNKYIFSCPSDTESRSYVLKKAINLAWLDPKIKARKLADYNWPADQILLYERGSFHWGNSNGDLSDPKNPNKLGATLNCVYMDTHMKTVRVTEFEPDYYNTVGDSYRPVRRPQINPRLYCDMLK